MGDGFAEQINLPAVRAEISAELANQCCFAGTIRTNNGVDLSGCETETHLIGREQAAIALYQRMRL
jgi:hypothetical protein